MRGPCVSICRLLACTLFLVSSFLRVSIRQLLLSEVIPVQLSSLGRGYGTSSRDAKDSTIACCRRHFDVYKSVGAFERDTLHPLVALQKIVDHHHLFTTDIFPTGQALSASLTTAVSWATQAFELVGLIYTVRLRHGLRMYGVPSSKTLVFEYSGLASPIRHFMIRVIASGLRGRPRSTFNS